MELVQQYLTIVQPTGTPYKYRESPFGPGRGSLNDGNKEVHFSYTSFNCLREMPIYDIQGRNRSIRIEAQSTIDISMNILLDNNEIYDFLHVGNGKPMILNTNRLKGTVHLQQIDFLHNASKTLANVTFRATDDFQLL
jgi:hypothetical protein